MSAVLPTFSDASDLVAISPSDLVARQLSHELARHMDAVTRDVLDRHLAPGWTLDDLRGRCTANEMLRSDGQRASITYYLDGKPVVRFYPAKFDQPVIDHSATMQMALEYEVFL